MKIHYIMMGFLFVSLIILAFIGPTGYFVELKDANDVTADFSSLNKTQVRLEQQQTNINKTLSIFNNIHLDNPLDYVSEPFKLVVGGWNALKTVFGSYSLVSAMISDISSGLAEVGIPLPSWLVGTIIAFIIFAIVAMVIYGIFKWRFEL